MGLWLQSQNYSQQVHVQQIIKIDFEIFSWFLVNKKMPENLLDSKNLRNRVQKHQKIIWVQNFWTINVRKSVQKYQKIGPNPIPPWHFYPILEFSKYFLTFLMIFLLPAVYNFQASMFWFSCDRWVRWCNTLFVLAYCSLSKNILAQRTRVVTFVEIELIQIHHSHEKLWRHDHIILGF